MKQWPLSTIAKSPLMPSHFAWEFYRIYATNYLSPACIDACNRVAHELKPAPAPNLLVIETVNGPARRVYADYPTRDEWFQLERACVISTDENIFILIDGLH